MNRRKEAVTIFENGYNCTQAVLTAFAKDYGLNDNLSLKIASGLGAGLGFQGKICGAVLGAYLVLGLHKGSHKPFDELSKEIVYNLTREFDKRFRLKFGSLECTEIIGTDLSTPKGYSYAEKNNLFETKCNHFVFDTIEIIEELINKH